MVLLVVVFTCPGPSPSPDPGGSISSGPALDSSSGHGFGSSPGPGPVQVMLLTFNGLLVRFSSAMMTLSSRTLPGSVWLVHRMTRRRRRSQQTPLNWMKDRDGALPSAAVDWLPLG